MLRQAEKFTGILIIGTMLLTSCGKKKSSDEYQQFTKIDSLTEKYLAYNDSILQTWNVMINDDNQKIKSLRYLVNIMLTSNEFSNDELTTLNERIDLLFENRYTPETLNEESIEEYDFTSNSLITEVTTQVQKYSKFAESDQLQKVVDEIMAAEQRVEKYRSDYDAIVERYNQFLEDNRSTIEAAEGLEWEKKIRFSY